MDNNETIEDSDEIPDPITLETVIAGSIAGFMIASTAYVSYRIMHAAARHVIGKWDDAQVKRAFAKANKEAIEKE